VANEEHIALLNQGVEVWNEWRKTNREIKPDLSGKYLSGADLRGADLSGVYLREVYLTGADLRGADLSGVYLRGADLSGADLSKADLSGAKLFRADLRGADFSKANLIEADLSKADLSGVYLRGADLSKADLSKANLSGADLSRTQALKTNFEEAIFTGACIADWNIDSETNLNDVICEYVYLKLNQQERCPNDPDQNFAPGEFTKLFQKTIHTVDLIFSDGIDWQVFLDSFEQLQEKLQVECNSDELAIQAIEKKPDGTLVIRVEVPPVEVPPDADRVEVEKYLKQEYEIQLKAVEDRYRLELNAKDNEIVEIFKQKSTDLLDIISTLANRSINISQTQGNNMADRTIDTSGAPYYEQSGNFGIGHMSDSEIKEGAKVAGVINEAEQQNLAEAIQIIESLRKNLEVLPDREACSEAVEHLNDLEAEAKETTPKQSRLKASLLALWNIGKDITAIASGITALAERFGISLPHLPLPPGN
jgi:uncharacterized protein YjbI with pentapeptide repeats